MTPFPLQLLPRWCPFCGKRTIIGHGQRRKQVHDDVHDVIAVRRGRCRPCHKTFTVLPVWSPPSGHYSFRCRQQAAKRSEEERGSLEQSTPTLRDPNRLPDPSTLRRWMLNRALSLAFALQAGFWKALGRDFLNAPTILAWDLPALCRMLRIEASSP